MAKVTITLDTEDMTLTEDFKSVGQLVTMLKAATNIPSAPYMTKSEVARFMGLKSVTPVDKWIKKGLPVVKIDGMTHTHQTANAYRLVSRTRDNRIMHTIHRALTINKHWARWLKGQLYGSQERS